MTQGATQDLFPQTSAVETINNFIASQKPLLLLLGNDKTYKQHIDHICLLFRKTYRTTRLHIDEKWTPLQFCKTLSQLTNCKLNKNSRLEQQLSNIVNHVQQQFRSYLFVIHVQQKLSLATLAAISYLAMLQEQHQVRLHILLIGPTSLNSSIKSVYTKDTPLVNLADLPEGVFARQQNQYRNNVKSKFFSACNKLIASLKHRSHSTQNQKNDKPSFWQQHVVKITAGMMLIFTGISLIWCKHHQPWNHINQYALRRTPTTLAQQQTLQQTQAPVFATANTSHMIITTATTATTPPPAIKHTNNYSIQLLASRHRNKIQAYLKHHHFRQQAFIHAEVRHHQHWYTLMIGHYSRRNQATAAIAQLPQKLQQRHPWVRKLSA